MKIKKNDNVIIIAGKDKGKKGKVTKIITGINKVVVEGINLKKKHQGPRRQNEKGQLIEIASPLDVSNVQIVDSKTKKGTRVGYKITEGKKIRIGKKSGAEI